MPTVDEAKFNPTKYFKRPMDVFEEGSLSREDKIKILRSWAYDELDKAVAGEENMLGPDSDKTNLLEEISKLLIKLGADPQDSAPNKQGG